MTPLDLLIISTIAICVLALALHLLGGGTLWRRRRSLWSGVPTYVIPTHPAPTTAEQARAWRRQALDEEHAFWEERFRAAGGTPPLRASEMERQGYRRMPDGSWFAGYYSGSNSRMFDGFYLTTPDLARATYGRRMEKAASMRRRWADGGFGPHAFDGASTWVGAFGDQPCTTCDRVATADIHATVTPSRTDWRTPLRDLVDPAR